MNMEDSVDETESVKRYNQYKLDFRRQQLQDFFLQHKDQEWFRSKYHPDDITARKAESLAALKTRLGVFLFLLDNNWLDNVSLDMEHAPAIIKLLDAGRDVNVHVHMRVVYCCQGLKRALLCFSAAVIKMEGGTDLDLQVLEVPAAPAAAGGDASSSGAGGAVAGGGGGEKSQGDPSRGNGQTGSPSTSSRTEATTSGEAGEIKDSDKVGHVVSSCSRPVTPALPLV